MTVKSNSNFPILGLLGLIFVTLKLVGVITWPWIWVLSPFWLPICAIIVITIIVFLLYVFKN